MYYALMNIVSASKTNSNLQTMYPKRRRVYGKDLCSHQCPYSVSDVVV